MESQMNLYDNIQKLCNTFRNMFHGSNGNSVDSPHTQTDAILSNLRKITDDDIITIEKELDHYEKVSLIFLLYDSSEEALKLFYDENQNFLQNWVRNELKNHSETWQNKILEAICIIQNYSVLKKLGFDKKEMIARFIPNNFSTSLYIHHVKKALYMTCEVMNNSDTKKFIDTLRLDFENRSLPFQKFPEKYLELYYLNCFATNYIKFHNVSNLIKIFKEINLESVRNILASVSSPQTETIERDNMRENYSQPRIENDRLSIRSLDKFPEDSYPMDPKNAGICLIINQEKFEIKKDADKFSLPINLKEPLQTRGGTNNDQKVLKNTFEYFGFRVKTHKDVEAAKILPKIKETMNDFTSQDCCFITCILSHGQEGQVFGSDCIPVDISEIEDAIHDKKFMNLLNKPKVLILQSCQGEPLQEAVDLSMYNSTDGPAKQKIPIVPINNFNVTDAPSITPEKCDLLIFKSTIAGYASIRNDIQGSWFIQELCEVLKEDAHRDHMLDITTTVIRRITEKVWKKDGKITCMVPKAETYLRKKLYFIPVNQ